MANFTGLPFIIFRSSFQSNCPDSMRTTVKSPTLDGTVISIGTFAIAYVNGIPMKRDAKKINSGGKGSSISYRYCTGKQ